MRPLGALLCMAGVEERKVRRRRKRREVGPVYLSHGLGVNGPWLRCPTGALRQGDRRS